MNALPDFKPQALADFSLEAWPADLLPHTSASALKQFNTCPEQFRRVRILGERARPSGAILWGRADHAAVEQNFRQKVETREDLDIELVKTIFAEELDRAVDFHGEVQEVEWDSKEPNLTASDARKRMAAVKDQGVQLVGLYQQQEAPRVQPLAVEEPFSIELPGVPVPVNGIIDVEADLAEWWKLGAPVHERLIDRKTVGQQKIRGEWVIQGRIYQLVKAKPIEFQLSLKPGPKRKRPKVVTAFKAEDPSQFVHEPPPPALTIAQIRRTMVAIAECYSIYGPDDPWPDAISHDWACSYCGFQPTCPWWNHGHWEGRVRRA